MRRAALVLAVLATLGCDNESPAGPPSEPAELDGARVAQAFESLRPRLGAEPLLLELRADSTGVVVQVVHVESTPNEVTQFRCHFGADGQPDGDVEGPHQAPLRGSGDMTENSFPLAEIDLPRITAAFSVARRAVDPVDGRVRELVVRRMLPFHRAVRARIFVDSPRMSGSIDTNPSGTPLRP